VPWYHHSKGWLAAPCVSTDLGGLLFLYGPFRERGVPHRPEYATFDADLQARRPVTGAYATSTKSLCSPTGMGSRRPNGIAMPANNLSLCSAGAEYVTTSTPPEVPPPRTPGSSNQVTLEAGKPLTDAALAISGVTGHGIS